MDELRVNRENESTAVSVKEITLENRLDIIGEGLRKKYLSRLTEMQIAPVGELLPLEEDLIDNVRMYHITEMVYGKGESVTDKFTTVFNTLSTYNATVFIVMDSDGRKSSFYIGVRNNETDPAKKRSTVTLGDTLKNALIGHFPGVKISNVDRSQISVLSDKIRRQQNMASVSVVGNTKNNKEQQNEQFAQGLEKLALAMQGRQYIALIVAENQPPQAVQILRKEYQDLYTKLSPLQKVQTSDSRSDSTSRSKSFAEMDGKQKAAMIGGAVASLAGSLGGAALGATVNSIQVVGGSMLGGQIAGQFNGFINSLAPSEQVSYSYSTSKSTTMENKTVTDLMQLLDESLKRTNEFDSYGIWNVAGYFISDDMSAAEIAASNYRSLMNGENSGREVSAINSWRQNDLSIPGNYSDLTTYLSRFAHPKFIYGHDGGYNVYTDASTVISGKELGLHLGLPRATISGLPVIQHAEFGKEVITYHLFSKEEELNPDERITLGRVFDLGQITNKKVELKGCSTLARLRIRRSN